MLPKDPVRRAEIRAFCEIINSSIHPFQSKRMLNRVAEGGIDRKQFAFEWIERGTAAIEKCLAKTRGKYCFGDEVTLADAFLIPHLLPAINRYGMKIDNYPNCKEVMGNLQKL